MSTVTVPKLMTHEEFEALPENGVERMILKGVLWEKPMTRRNPDHSSVEAELARQLGNWVKQQPRPRGRVYSGEVGFRLREDPISNVGIDVAYISPELAGATPRGAGVIKGVPILAAEILSPSDKHEEIAAKVAEYLEVGVTVVWLLDPDFRTVSVYRRDEEPEMFNRLQELTCEPHLPGFKVAVAELFED
jgi:Uma2 family endonuclease